jgi:hypothetical protein
MSKGGRDELRRNGACVRARARVLVRVCGQYVCVCVD